jgi:hypothetical protein
LDKEWRRCAECAAGAGKRQEEMNSHSLTSLTGGRRRGLLKMKRRSDNSVVTEESRKGELQGLLCDRDSLSKLNPSTVKWDKMSMGESKPSMRIK